MTYNSMKANVTEIVENSYLDKSIRNCAIGMITKQKQDLVILGNSSNLCCQKMHISIMEIGSENGYTIDFGT